MSVHALSARQQRDVCAQANRRACVLTTNNTRTHMHPCSFLVLGVWAWPCVLGRQVVIKLGIAPTLVHSQAGQCVAAATAVAPTTGGRGRRKVAPKQDVFEVAVLFSLTATTADVGQVIQVCRRSFPPVPPSASLFPFVYCTVWSFIT